MQNYIKTVIKRDCELWDQEKYEIINSPLVIKPINYFDEAQKEIEIRIQVFMNEQGFSYESEFDNEEKQSIGFLLYLNKDVIGTFSYVDRGNNTIFYRRLAILPKYRQKGYGKLLFQFMEENLRKKYSPLTIVFHGEKYLESYWRKLGYTIIKEVSEGPTCPPLLLCKKEIK